MKRLMNFAISQDDVERYESREDLRRFYETAGCDGLEVMPLEEDKKGLVGPGMVVGVHACCFGDWMERDEEELIRHFRKDLDYARRMKAEFVVFHVTQVDDEECVTCRMRHSDAEVVQAACVLINRLLDGQAYDFWFLMENLWWPGLNYLDASVTRMLLEGVHYKKKGLMLDTGHFLHTNQELRTQKEALMYLHGMLDAHKELLSYIKGIHLHQSLSGAYVKEWLSRPHVLEEEPLKRMGQVFEHIFSIDRHLPFTEPEVSGLVDRLKPSYLTLEYITRSRAEHARYLREGMEALSSSGILILTNRHGES